ncbi:MAG: 4,5-DOPA dioxygenase extradiol, partial [Planctomycetales bacterium]|nr:4,5-DOPA dioxygenase extradiol [Planctomycetales bacterium]
MAIGPFVAGKLSRLQALAETLPKTEVMPALFVGHGSPMNAVEENQFVRGFREIAATLPQPKAILCISAHWFTDGTKVTAMAKPKTIHDFGGFPPELFQIQYPAPGSPELAEWTTELAKPTAVKLDNDWGLDHGAWTVAMHMYPKADIPIIQLSIDRGLAPEGHFQLGRQLNALRQRGVLILGSGNIVHNLRLVDFPNFHRKNYGFDWAIEARQFVNRCL